MIDYIIAHNPDDRTLSKIDQSLRAGQLVAFPTQTNWLVVTSLASVVGVEALYRLIGSERTRHLDLVCLDISQASQYAIVSDMAFKVMRALPAGEYTFLLESTKGVPRKIRDYRKDKCLAIRFADAVFITRLLENLELPLIARAITPEMVGEEEGSFSHLFSYQIELALGHHLSHILDPGCEGFAGPSTFLDLTGVEPLLLREGIGKYSP